MSGTQPPNNDEGPPQDTTLPAFMAERAKGKPYLGDLGVVSRLVGGLIGGVISNAPSVADGEDARLAAGKNAVKLAEEFVRVISGKDDRYMPVPQWNADPAGLEAFLREALVDEAHPDLLAKHGGPMEAVGLMVLLRTYDILGRMAGSSEEELTDMVDMLNAEATRLIMGVAPDPDTP